MAESRLAFVASTLAFGGAERVWSQLVPELARRGFGVRVLTLVEEGHFFHEHTTRGLKEFWTIYFVVTGLHADIREVLMTTVLDADPDHRIKFPNPSIWPLLAAIATTGLFIGSIFTPWAVPIGAVPVTITLIGWFWPTEKEHEDRQHAG